MIFVSRLLRSSLDGPSAKRLDPPAIGYDAAMAVRT
jgi:hypothetical protein